MYDTERMRGGIMTQEKDVDEMPIWQNHEQRITTLEVTMTGLSSKMDDVEKTIRDVDKTVKDGNEKAEKKLDVNDERLMDEFFIKKRSSHDNKWNLLFKILGVGGIGYLFFDLVISKFI